MTTETSNARGEVVLWVHPQSVSDLERAPEGAWMRVFTRGATTPPDGWRTLTYADAAPPAAARGDVRGLVAKLAAHVRPTCSELWDEAQAFLAAEGVQAGEVESAIAESGMGTPMTLAVALHFADFPRPHPSMKAPADTNGELYKALKVLAAAYRSALSQQPEARGVVDGPMVRRALMAEYEGHGSVRDAFATGTDWAEEMMEVALTAALTGERNG